MYIDECRKAGLTEAQIASLYTPDTSPRSPLGRFRAAKTTTSSTDQLTAAGYALTDMGGGVMCWRLAFGAGELLITDDGEGADAWTVMLYGGEHSEPLDSLTGASLADAIEAGEVFRLQAAGCNA